MRLRTRFAVIRKRLRSGAFLWGFFIGASAGLPAVLYSQASGTSAWVLALYCLVPGVIVGAVFLMVGTKARSWLERFISRFPW
ncbi:hypothetical protein TSACC_2775 [Terrimicrobium sacchariphilum]|uniref:Uncharacterized protein n=1 Tax=Terrimicrobium sacchariphilum TaxID=690879 RepID=A0A146G5Z8_TERSA|nr:hypothetical protein [Terrimicrobium sacchariphilum]GAT32377.1 hypothetical protein TSACC_2775 [Terrimicrobium sacchariphilum]